MNFQGKRDLDRNISEFELTKSEITNSEGELEKKKLRLSGTCRFSCRASYFSFSLVRRARGETSHLPTKSRKARFDSGKQDSRTACPEGQA